MVNPVQHDLHFVLFPLMAQGHTIPMVDIAKLLAQRSATVTIITTPVNALRFQATVTRAVEAGLKIRVVELYFPSEEVGLPKGCENFDMLAGRQLSGTFFAAIMMLQEPFEAFLADAKPPPSCIISDMCLPWTTDVANKFHIPRIVFHGPSCFSLLSMHHLFRSKVLDEVASDTEHFVVPGLPDKVELTKPKIVHMIKSSDSAEDAALNDLRKQIMESDTTAYGIVANTFEELEPEYVKEFAKAKGKKLWCIGPVSLCNKDILEKVERGNKASINEHECLNWLASHEPASVVYVCLGSLGKLATSQLIELGLGLEQSNKPFIWCIKSTKPEFEKWISDEKFEERVKGRGLLIWGWAPQVLILSHKSVGGFLTHCGWNSTLEGICAGIPMLTWPLFAEQFLNEALVIEILRTAVSVGAELPINFGEEETVGVVVKKENIKVGVEKLMNEESDEAKERRERAKELGELAQKAMEEGGSSFLNINLFIQEIIGQAKG